MKVALITTPPSVRSGIGDYTRHLLPYLRQHLEVEVFVAAECAGEELDGKPTCSAKELQPRAFDRILYQLGNERAHAFMLPMVRSLGGVVTLHDWVLFDLATAAEPALERGGLGGHLAALRAGGVRQARRYARNRAARRRALRSGAKVEFGGLPGAGPLLEGWHAPEPKGRWTGRQAGIRLVLEDCAEVRVELELPAGRRVALEQEGRELASFRATPECTSTTLVAEPTHRQGLERHVTLALVVDGTRRSRVQLTEGDRRELGCFVRGIQWSAASGSGEVDLDAHSDPYVPGIELSSERFELPLNRAVVRLADAFVVHSRFMRDRILAERNAYTPVGLVPHGTERRWSDEPRTVLRGRLGLPQSPSLLVVSFGAIQEHKRTDRLLEALALARRERPDLHLVLAGEDRLTTWDLAGRLADLDLEQAVTVTGFLEDARIDDYLRAADLCVNLRGPSTGGTSGGIFRALSVGRAVVASESGEQAELPETCVLKVPHGDEEVQRLARLLVELSDDSERLAMLEAAAREYVEQTSHWSLAAERYAGLLEAFPAHRARRKSLVRTAIEQADRAREERRRG